MPWPGRRQTRHRSPRRSALQRFGIERRERLRIGANRERKAFELDAIWTRCLCNLLQYKETPKVRIPRSFLGGADYKPTSSAIALSASFSGVTLRLPSFLGFGSLPFRRSLQIVIAEQPPSFCRSCLSVISRSINRLLPYQVLTVVMLLMARKFAAENRFSQRRGF